MLRSRITVTAQQGRFQMYVSHLKETSLFLLQVYSRILFRGKNTTDYKNIQVVCLQAKQNSELYNEFYSEVTKHYPFLAQIIERAVEAHLHLNQMTSLAKRALDGNYVREPIHQLWLYLLRIIYCYPMLLMPLSDEKEATGEKIDKIRQALGEFIMISTPVDYALESLTLENVRNHDDELNSVICSEDKSVSNVVLAPPMTTVSALPTPSPVLQRQQPLLPKMTTEKFQVEPTNVEAEPKTKVKQQNNFIRVQVDS